MACDTSERYPGAKFCAGEQVDQGYGGHQTDRRGPKCQGPSSTDGQLYPVWAPVSAAGTPLSIHEPFPMSESLGHRMTQSEDISTSSIERTFKSFQPSHGPIP